MEINYHSVKFIQLFCFITIRSLQKSGKRFDCLWWLIVCYAQYLKTPDLESGLFVPVKFDISTVDIFRFTRKTTSTENIFYCIFFITTVIGGNQYAILRQTQNQLQSVSNHWNLFLTAIYTKVSEDNRGYHYVFECTIPTERILQNSR